MLKIYTDASVAKHVAITTCFALSDTDFLGYQTFRHENINTSIVGELAGAVSALKYMLECETDVTDAILYTDSQSLISLLNKDVMFKDKSSDSKLYPKLVSEFRHLVTTHNIQLQLIKGHQKELNPNKLVDLISVQVLRNSFPEDKIC